MMLLRSVPPIASLFTAISQISIAPISPQTYTANAEAAINELQTRYNTTTGVYDTTGYEIFLFTIQFACPDPSFFYFLPLPSKYSLEIY